MTDENTRKETKKIDMKTKEELLRLLRSIPHNENIHFVDDKPSETMSPCMSIYDIDYASDENDTTSEEDAYSVSEEYVDKSEDNEEASLLVKQFQNWSKNNHFDMLFADLFIDDLDEDMSSYGNNSNNKYGRFGQFDASDNNNQIFSPMDSYENTLMTSLNACTEKQSKSLKMNLNDTNCFSNTKQYTNMKNVKASSSKQKEAPSTIIDKKELLTLENLTTRNTKYRDSCKSERGGVKKVKSKYKAGIQLYQFMLFLLDDESMSDSIRWVDHKNGVFRIVNKEKVAKMWGYTRNRCMTYESLSRGLRHYYHIGVLDSVNKKMQYKFTESTMREWALRKKED